MSTLAIHHMLESGIPLTKVRLFFYLLSLAVAAGANLCSLRLSKPQLELKSHGIHDTVRNSHCRGGEEKGKERTPEPILTFSARDLPSIPRSLRSLCN